MIEVRYRVRPEVYLAADGAGGHTLVHGGRRADRLGVLSADEVDLLRALAVEALPRPDEHGALVDRLCDRGWLTRLLSVAGRLLVTVEPAGPVGDGATPRRPRLSRFALLRRDGDALVLEEPTARARILVHDDAVVALLHRLADGRPLDCGLPAAVVTGLVDLLARHGFVRDDECGDAVVEQWSPHELWFHAGSRAGHHDLPFGATYWAEGRHETLPARREPWPGAVTALPVPEGPLAPPLGEVLAARRSVRRGDDEHPLTLAELGGFLHHCARVRGSIGPDLTTRPVPSGGALHSVEIYPVVARMSGLDSGMYHYDPFRHELRRVPAPAWTVSQLVSAAAAAAQHESTPQVLLVLSARFGRVMRKYQSMAYALVLKEVGALVQTMYLVATAMGLAPCALGAGDAAVFAEATGLDPLAESSVGEFVLSTGAVG